jgi:hypothetical protein
MFIVPLKLSLFSGYRIETTGIKWIAAQYSPDCHATPLEYTIFVNCLISIMRTGWIKPTGIGSNNRGNELLIDTYE